MTQRLRWVGHTLLALHKRPVASIQLWGSWSYGTVFTVTLHCTALHCSHTHLGFPACRQVHHLAACPQWPRALVTAANLLQQLRPLHPLRPPAGKSIITQHIRNGTELQPLGYRNYFNTKYQVRVPAALGRLMCVSCLQPGVLQSATWILCG